MATKKATKKKKGLKAGERRTYKSKSGAVYELHKVSDGKAKPRKKKAPGSARKAGTRKPRSK